MKHPSEYPAGWRRSVANEHRINEIVRQRVRSGLDDTSTSDTFEFWGEVIGGVCFCLGVVLLIVLGAALS